MFLQISSLWLKPDNHINYGFHNNLFFYRFMLVYLLSRETAKLVISMTNGKSRRSKPLLPASAGFFAVCLESDLDSIKNRDQSLSLN